jgi:hypothetical protein
MMNDECNRIICWLFLHFTNLINARNMENIKISISYLKCIYCVVFMETLALNAQSV